MVNAIGHKRVRNESFRFLCEAERKNREKTDVRRREWNHEKTPRVEMNYPRVDEFALLNRLVA